MNKRTLGPLELNLLRLSVDNKRGVALHDYSSIAGLTDTKRCTGNFKATIAKLNRTLKEGCGFIMPLDKKDGLLVYALEKTDKPVDALLAEKAALKAEQMLYSNTPISEVQKTVEKAKAFDKGNHRLNRVRHSIALQQPDSMEWLLGIAQINLCRQHDLEKRLSNLEKLIGLSQWNAWRALIENRMNQYEEELSMLWMLSTLTLSRRAEDKKQFSQNESLMQLCSLATLSRYLDGHHQQAFRDGFASHAAIKQLAMPIAGHLVKKVNAYANVQIGYEDVLVITGRVITIYMLYELGWHRFIFQDGLWKLSRYIYRSCCHRAYSAVVAEQVCTSTDNVALAYRLWRLEKQNKSKEEIMVSLKLTDEAYETVCQTTEVLREKRLSPELMERLSKDDIPEIQEPQSKQRTRSERERAITRLIRATDPKIVLMARSWATVIHELRKDGIENPLPEQICAELKIGEPRASLLRDFLLELEELLGEGWWKIIYRLKSSD